MVFKVPTLRNIEKTAPYYHDGSISTLDEAVRQMADHQLARTLSKEETDSIVAFLKALTGELPAEYIKEPALPKSTGKTPKAG
jgi:cytochrome c peroxidase